MESTLVTALRAVLSRETGKPVEVIETHISWVLLTPLYAYKLKKPVHFPFVDFSSAQARQHFCEEELRLNRRFAPSIYLDVVPVHGTADRPYLGGDTHTTPIDHVVRMRRFEQSSLLRNLIVSHRLNPDWIDDLADRLAKSHFAEPAMTGAQFGHPDRILTAVDNVLNSLQAQQDDLRLTQIHAWLAERAVALRPVWGARQEGGSIRECHGDLHMANIVLIEDALVPFDCIEFDPEFRWIDVISDLAFVTMDLKAHGRADLAFRLLDGWLQRSGDHAGLSLLKFYEVYRALVRGMTQRLGQPKAVHTPDYLACATTWATVEPQGRARLLIMHGLSGSGKSTVAFQLMSAAGAIRIRSDVERKRLYGLAPLERPASSGLDIYTVDANDKTLESLKTRARTALQAGYPVIVDAAFLKADWRREFRALAAELEVPFSILSCGASVTTLRRRVAARTDAGTDASDAGVEELERQLAICQPLEADERAVAIEVSTEELVNIDFVEACWCALNEGHALTSVTS